MITALPKIVKQWLQLPHISRQTRLDTQAVLQHIEAKIKPDLTLWQIGIKTANHCIELQLDSSSIITALIIPVIKSHINSSGMILNELNLSCDLKELCQTTLKCSKIDDIQWNSNYAKTEKHKRQARQILLSLVEDMRAIPIILSIRLTELENAKNYTPKIQKEIATQTKLLYTPIANRLGFGQIKWQLEDYCMRYLNQEKYHEIAKSLDLKRSERVTLINNLKDDLEKVLNENGINNIQVNGRAKNINSIFNKMQKKNIPLAKLYDQLALRVLLPTINDCYQTLAILHKQWSHHKEEFDDYIAHPKPNGYQSIHTVIYLDDKYPVEVQIRTFTMHEASEHGVAAHWAYKEKGLSTAQEQQKMHSLRQLLEIQNNIQTNNTANETSINSMFIYVFTPQGHICELPFAATGLDFAYQVHTQIGHRCRGILINKKLSPLTQSLRTGDHVEVLLKKEPQPSRDWLSKNNTYIKTKSARKKIELWFRQHDKLIQIEAGKEIWDKISRKNHLKTDDVKIIRDKMSLKSRRQVFIALEQGTLSSTKCLQHLNITIDQPKASKEKTPAKIISEGSVKTSSINELLYQLGKCCAPLPGDKIIGYVTRSRGVTIHRHDCRHVFEIKHKEPERLLSVSWHNAQSNKNFMVQIKIFAETRDHLLRDISSALASENISMQAATISPDKKNPQVVIIDCRIIVKSYSELKTAKSSLLQIPDIYKVERA